MILRIFCALLFILAPIAAAGQYAMDEAGYVNTVPVEAIGLQFQWARAVRDTYDLRYLGWKEWNVDWPDMDDNLHDVLRMSTNINIGQPVIIKLDEHIFQYPLLYFVEPESVSLSEKEVVTLRTYLDRGGMIVMDDFHGDEEMYQVMWWLRRVRPELAAVPLEMNDPLFHVFYDINSLDRVANVGLARTAEPWENGPSGMTPQVYGSLGKYGNWEIIMAFNMDLGDSLEWALDPDYPQAMVTAGAKLLTNICMYSLTH